MKCDRFTYSLILALILTFLIMSPLMAAPDEEGSITISPARGKAGDSFRVNGSGFDSNRICRIYFSSDRVEEGAKIDTTVTAYKHLGIANTDSSGDFVEEENFSVPEELTDGRVKEYVHNGQYYVYVTYYDSTTIVSSATFTIIGSFIQLDLQEGQVGTWVQIIGQQFAEGKRITIKFDNNLMNVIRGDKGTDDNGRFNCVVVIPQTTAGIHSIIVTDERGGETSADFIVKPSIALNPTTGSTGDTITIRGMGFKEETYITIVVDRSIITTTPRNVLVNDIGSFTAEFELPLCQVTPVKVEARDRGDLWAEADLNIAELTGITIHPATSPDSPGYIGMRLTVYGSGFASGSEVKISYDDIEIQSTTADAAGECRASIIVPISDAGTHTISITDGISEYLGYFTMESEAPPAPVVLAPVISADEQEIYFDWEDVDDPSGVTYSLEIGTGKYFTEVVLMKEGLPNSEYTLTQEEELPPMTTPYYWRVRATDNAGNGGEWTKPVTVYVPPSWEVSPVWPRYVLPVVLVILIGLLVFLVLRRIRVL